MNQANKIKTFTQLIAWQKSHKLVIKIYEITKKFPKEELYSLTDQMRRSSISISSNIAEGFSRKSYKEKVQFYSMALGSTTELQNQLLVSRDVKYLSSQEFLIIAEQTVEVNKLINGLIKGAKNYIKKA